MLQALPVEGCAGNPSAPPEEIDDDVTGLALSLDSGADDCRRGGWREAVERGQRETWSAVQEKIRPCHVSGEFCQTPIWAQPIRAGPSGGPNFRKGARRTTAAVSGPLGR